MFSLLPLGGRQVLCLKFWLRLIFIGHITALLFVYCLLLFVNVCLCVCVQLYRAVVILGLHTSRSIVLYTAAGLSL